MQVGEGKEKTYIMLLCLGVKNSVESGHGTNIDKL